MLKLAAIVNGITFMAKFSDAQLWVAKDALADRRIGTLAA
jgi:hypothetical protein